MDSFNMIEKEQPLFTVATITYNSSKWIKQGLDSILASTFTNFEIIISDDCSTDDTWEIIKQYQDSRIRAYRSMNNIGEYPNRNKVLNFAKGKYIIYVDGDDILYKNTLRNLSEYIMDFPEAASIWGVPSRNFWFAVLPYVFYPPLSMRLIHETKLDLAYIGLSETVFKVSVLKDIGGFTENYKIGDTWLKKRLAIEYPILFVPMGFMLWRQSLNQASKKINNLDGAFLENYRIDMSLLSMNYGKIDDGYKKKLLLDIKSSFLKNLINNTFPTLSIKQFFKIMNAADLSLLDLKLIFRKRDMNYVPVKDISMPLIMKNSKDD